MSNVASSSDTAQPQSATVPGGSVGAAVVSQCLVSQNNCPSRVLSPLAALVATLLCVLVTSLSGCGYAVGQPYAAEYRTIHVPTFTNETFRRGYELQLTEAVHKKIELNTPFRLAKGFAADTTLTGHIVAIDKRSVNQNRFDDPRELELAIGIEVTWTDNRTGAVLARQVRPVNAQVAHAISQTSFAPEVGQSLATATHSAVDELASEIVGLLEAPW